MAYKTFDGFTLTPASPTQKTVLQSDGDTVELPYASMTRDADMSRDGMDLIMEGPEGTIVVEGYYEGTNSPTLTAPDGSVLTPELVDSFTKAPAQQYAQGLSATDESPVGAIQEISGNTTITHIDGSTETAAIGTPVYQGDIIETGATGATNIMFIDGTEFAVSEDARLSIDEYVFDPATNEGATDFSVLKGIFVFTSGLIGREDPDDVNIDTPMGSIGIRGTIIAGDVDSGEITVVEGAIVLKDFNGNEVTLANQFETAKFDIAAGEIQKMGQLSANDVGAKFHSVSGVSANLFSSINDAAKDQTPDADTDANTETEATDGPETDTETEEDTETQTSDPEDTNDAPAPEGEGESKAEGEGEAKNTKPAPDNGDKAQLSETAAEIADMASKNLSEGNGLETIVGDTTKSLLGDTTDQQGQNRNDKKSGRQDQKNHGEDRNNNELAPLQQDAETNAPAVVQGATLLAGSVFQGVFASHLGEDYSHDFSQYFADPEILAVGHSVEYRLSTDTINFLNELSKVVNDPLAPSKNHDNFLNGDELDAIGLTKDGTDNLQSDIDTDNQGWTFNEITGELILYFDGSFAKYNTDTNVFNNLTAGENITDNAFGNAFDGFFSGIGEGIGGNFALEISAVITDGNGNVISTQTDNQLVVDDFKAYKGHGNADADGDGETEAILPGSNSTINETGDELTTILGTEHKIFLDGTTNTNEIEITGTNNTIYMNKGASDIIKIDADNTTIYGSDGADKMKFGQSGTDYQDLTFAGMAGNDSVELHWAKGYKMFSDNKDVTLDGGAGYDTLKFEGVSNLATLDFTALLTRNSIENFEKIDISGNSGAQTIMLNYDTIMGMTGDEHELSIDLDGSDSVKLQISAELDGVTVGENITGTDSDNDGYYEFHLDNEVTLLVQGQDTIEIVA